MKPEAIDAILATNPRYTNSETAYHAVFGCGLAGRFALLEDAKLNAAKAIVAERLSAMLEIYLKSSTPLYYTNENTRNSLLKTLNATDRANLEEAQAAIIAWRELIE